MIAHLVEFPQVGSTLIATSRLRLVSSARYEDAGAFLTRVRADGLCRGVGADEEYSYEDIKSELQATRHI